MSKSICPSARAPRIARASKIALATRIVVRFLCCFRLQNYGAAKGIKSFWSTFILTSESKSKSKHSNLLKKKQIQNKQRKKTNTKQNNITLNQLKPLWVIKAPKCFSGRWHIYSQQNRWFSNKVEEPFAKWPFLLLFKFQMFRVFSSRFLNRTNLLRSQSHFSYVLGICKFSPKMVHFSLALL